MNPSSARLANLHWPLVLVTLLIGLLGVYNLHSAAAAREPQLYLTQLLWLAAGVAAMALILVPDYRATETLAYVAYTIVCLLLVAVLLNGSEAGGARRWLAVGPGRFQPSEFAKLATVICLARYFSHRPVDGGYSMGWLFRPLNPTRPLAFIVLLGVFWARPWMVDPLGELARFVHTKPIATADDLLWFRIALILLVLAACAAGFFYMRDLEGRLALLNPWPPGRRKQLTLMWFALGVAAIIGVAVAWRDPFVADPVGITLRWLHQAAAVGGPLETLESGFWLRAFLVLVAAVFVAASALVNRQAGLTVDTLLAPIDLLAIPSLLILGEPDLGTAGVVILVGLTVIFVVGLQFRSMLTMGVLGAMVAAVAWFGVLKDYQKRRILTFIDPETDIRGAGWNAVQSMIAVGSGKWWGKGHKGGTQSQLSFLPEQHTDFVFPVWAEEQGFVGCFVVLALYLVLLIVAFAIAANARDTYGTLLSTGVAAIILWHVLINIGMVIGMMPVVGLPLPLFSYGGSSLLTVMIGVGLLLNVHWRRQGR